MDSEKLEPTIHYVPVCAPCLASKGEICDTPGCVFIRHRTPAEWPIKDVNLFDIGDDHAALRARVSDYEEVLADHRRLVRELDVALSGEAGAAKQASLCDLIGPAEKMRARVSELEQKLAAVERRNGELVDWIYDKQNHAVLRYVPEFLTEAEIEAATARREQS